MTLSGLALRNAFLRNKTRSTLTVLGVTIAALAFVFIRTVLSAWYANAEASSSDRLVTRNNTSIIFPLPLSYRERILQVPGVTKVTWSNWFGGKYGNGDRFFAQFAIDAATGLDVFEVRFTEGSKQDFLADRNTAILGKNLARDLKFKVGDMIPLTSEIYPGEWKFRIAGLVEADDASVGNTMYFHWARLNEGLPAVLKDRVGVYTMLVPNAAESPRVANAIDTMFANSDNETHTETEKSFRLQFVQSSSAILGALQILSIVVLLIMVIILGNVVAMGLRERTSEMGALRAIGFLPKHVQILAWVEGSLLGLAGGLLGVLLANPMLNGFGRLLAGMGFLSGLGFQPLTGVIAVLLATSIGFLSSAAPAWSASQMDVVTALRRQE